MMQRNLQQFASGQKYQFTSPLKEYDMNHLSNMQQSSNHSNYSFHQNSNLSLRRNFTDQHSEKIQVFHKSTRTNYKQNVAPQQFYHYKFNTKNNTCQKKNNVLKFHYQNSQVIHQKTSNSTTAAFKPAMQIQPFLIDNLYQNLSVNCFSTVQKENEIKKLQVSNFKKIRQLGKGKFGTVWLVCHKQTNFICAMKIIKKSVVRQQKVEHQIAKQIRIHNTLKHMNIIAFYGFFDDEQNMYILTQFATGGQVYSLLKKDFRLKQNIVQTIIKQTADGLHFMHNLGYIHRDIKPQNLIIQFNTIKICDLGWTAQCSERQMRKSICGTPLYYSPELVKQTQHNSAIDVWSLGILAYELLIGRVPFKIWSQFDLHVIIQQEIIFPDYVDLLESTKRFISNCLNKNQFLRPSISSLKLQQFLKKKPIDLSCNLFNEFQQIF